MKIVSIIHISLFCQCAIITLLCCACVNIFTCLMESLSNILGLDTLPPLLLTIDNIISYFKPNFSFTLHKSYLVYNLMTIILNYSEHIYTFHDHIFNRHSLIELLVARASNVFIAWRRYWARSKVYVSKEESCAGCSLSTAAITATGTDLQLCEKLSSHVCGSWTFPFAGF